MLVLHCSELDVTVLKRTMYRSRKVKARCYLTVTAFRSARAEISESALC